MKTLSIIAQEYLGSIFLQKPIERWNSLTQLLQDTRVEGFNDGLEAAAIVCDDAGNDNPDEGYVPDRAELIRALKGKTK